jgi:hypothetical protein
LERLGWEGENPQRVVVPNDDDNDDDDDDNDDSINIYAKKLLHLRFHVYAYVYKKNKYILKIYLFLHFWTSNLNKAAYTEKQHPCRKLLSWFVTAGRVLSAGLGSSSSTYV